MIDETRWKALAHLLEEGWPGDFDDTASLAYRLLLDGYEAPQVIEAIKALIAKGARFRPSVAELVAEIRRDPGRPTFSEVRTFIFGRGGVLAARTPVDKSRWEPGERDRLDEEAMRQRAGEMHPLIAAFVDGYGLDRLRRLDLDDGEYGAARIKMLADEWEEFVDRNEDRDVAALVAGERRGELGRFDPRLALPVAAPVDDGPSEPESIESPPPVDEAPEREAPVIELTGLWAEKLERWERERLERERAARSEAKSA